VANAGPLAATGISLLWKKLQGGSGKLNAPRWNRLHRSNRNLQPIR